ncbi:pyruvate, phosphate dikinase [Criibacterium bergeronii]|uniref:Pyruvate, phosphate dikinase n=1 Tax=Criibacterium bergeronii TaxID=1871336 RepID=A0A552VD63_9FIRM|nr:pyruvate, phosphate dikinase [Criibacterium bergeronii]TRW28370.1 pyruvate, phosphate dikinase [Criibacterium bergeronii]
MSEKKYVYDFNEGDMNMRSLLGGKGANLAEMTNIGLPVPQGFTISTEACLRFYDEDKKLWPDLLLEIDKHLENVEKLQGKKFSDPQDPLLFSVRSGAAISMPGMMDTILNLGLNDETVKGLARTTNNERFAYDSYRRFIQMFSDVAIGIPKALFDAKLDGMKEEKGVKNDTDLNAEDLKNLVEQFKKVYKEEMKEDFPQEPKVQLQKAVEAVFSSWNNNRAKVYRKLNNISDSLGTAVNVQSMVFGNKGATSGTGVAFTRNPATGENKLFGEFLMNAQGEDVVAGIRTPESIDKLKEINEDAYNQFVEATHTLENHYHDMQDIEFTIEEGRLFFLQTRNGKRTAEAAVKVAVDQVKEGLIDKKEAIMRVEPKQLDQLLHPAFKADALKKAVSIAKGLPASPGAGSGKIYFNAEDAVAAAKSGQKVLLVRQETSPEDIEGMVSAEGILTARGGMTSHAAVVARGMGKCCVAGCSEARVDEISKTMRIGDKVYKEGDVLSLDGSTGSVYDGEVAKAEPELTGDFGQFMDYVNEIKKLGVYTNADTPRDAKQAVKFGAEGIGLCRTEHMFFDEKRIPAVRRMILSKSVDERKKALAEILPMQKEDFIGIYQAMEGRPVVIRLLDPPLHEFLPKEEKDLKAIGESMGISYDDVRDRVLELAEFNPMLGHRGCRLGITYPEISRMQARAIIEAALEVKKQYPVLKPEIMVPLVGHVNELKYVKEQMVDEINKVFEEKGEKIDYLIGTMIEVPRAAITADEIAKEAEFFSFGTNDLTQMGFGFSRDDSSKFLADYESKNIFDFKPFETIDQEGIGKLMKMAVDYGKQTRPDIILGICGEHGGDPATVEFCHKLGLNYVSCSPFRVPIARLAAAQAVVKESK